MTNPRVRPWKHVALALLIAAGISACSSESKGGNPQSSGNGSPQSGAPVSSEPLDPVLTAAIGTKPPTGKSVVFLELPLDTGPKYAAGAEAATEALGWKFSKLVLDTANPGAAMQQAINQKPNYIMVTGAAADVMRVQLRAANEAGIAVLSCITPDAPAEDGFAANCYQNVIDPASKVLDWMIQDSDKKGHIVVVSAPEYPVVQKVADWAEDNIDDLCPDCKLSVFDITGADIASGASSQQIAGYLRAHPDVKYVLFPFSSAAAPLPAALRSAGLNDIHIGGVGANETLLKGVVNGTQSAWAATSYELAGWMLTDAAARLASGAELSADYLTAFGKTPSFLVATPADAEKILSEPHGDWSGPAGYQDAFRSAWQLTN